MSDITEIRSVKEDVEKDFLSISNVTGVDIGNKIVNGKETDELAIIVYVAKKMDEKDVKKDELIPKIVENIKTDIIEKRFILPNLLIEKNSNGLQVMADFKMPNISLGPCRLINGKYTAAGTLGAIVKDNDSGEIMLLSNRHVMFVDTEGKVGDLMSQPALLERSPDCCRGSKIGEIVRGSYFFDCAIAKSYYDPKCVSCGTILGTASNYVVGDSVHKMGSRTGLTYGFIKSLDLSVAIDYPDDQKRQIFYNNIIVDPNMSKNKIFAYYGDSGSVVVNDQDEALGLLFAISLDSQGNPLDGILIPIKNVLEALDISICESRLDPDKFTAQNVSSWL